MGALRTLASISRWDGEADVVIVGYGGAGACAALEAAAAGTRVRPERGRCHQPCGPGRHPEAYLVPVLSFSIWKVRLRRQMLRAENGFFADD
jgi:choline dehydrogenase-like flavoprotein